MRHREVDRPRAHLLGPGLRPPGELHPRLRPTDDLDLAPGEANAAAERLADGLLAREPRGVVLGRPPTAVAVLALGVRKAAGPEPRVAFERALDALDADPELTWMVGDDLDADIAGAKSCGLSTILVRTGKFREETLVEALVKPDAVVDSIGDVPDYLAEL